MKYSLCFFSLLFLVSPAAYAVDLPGIPQFIDEMVEKHHFDRNELVRTFQLAEHRPDIIAAISAPATTKPWLEYRAAFINSQRITGGVKFWKRYPKALKRAEKKFGIPQEIIVAVIGVETLYGRQAGRFRTLDALITLAFDYPRRAEFFRKELQEYFLLAREQKFNLLEIKSSYAGAMGIPQFMPSSYRKYAVDFNGNGKVDLLNEPEDAIGSVANYLKQYGWNKGEPVALLASLHKESAPLMQGDPHTLAVWSEVGIELHEVKKGNVPPAWLLDFTITQGKEYWLIFNNFRVITLYNNSNFYAMSVYQLAQALHAARHAKP